MREIVADKTPRKVYCFPSEIKKILLILTLTLFALVVSIAVCYVILLNLSPNFIFHIVLLCISFLFLSAGNLIFYSPIISFKAKIK